MSRKKVSRKNFRPHPGSWAFARNSLVSRSKLTGRIWHHSSPPRRAKNPALEDPLSIREASLSSA